MRLGRIAVGLGALAGLSFGFTGSAVAASDCAAWPREFDPLPTVTDHDFMRAQWAQMRATELARFAVRLEGEDPVESQRLWLHALCLNPESKELARGVERSLVALKQRSSQSLTVSLAPAPASPSQEIAARVGGPTPPAVDAPPPIDPCRVGAENCIRLRDVDHWLAQLDRLIRTAHFDEVVSQQRRPRILLDALPRSSATRRRRVRLEILSATAHVALGRREEAEACFGRALAADPNLRLNPGTTSPKVLRVLDYARDTYVAHNAR